jgi:hypothetical protein
MILGKKSIEEEFALPSGKKCFSGALLMSMGQNQADRTKEQSGNGSGHIRIYMILKQKIQEKFPYRSWEQVASS